MKLETLTVHESSHTDKLTQMKTQNMKKSFYSLVSAAPCNKYIIFLQVSESAVFNEITLEKYADENWKQWLKEETQESEYIQNEEE